MFVLKRGDILFVLRNNSCKIFLLFAQKVFAKNDNDKKILNSQKTVKEIFIMKEESIVFCKTVSSCF